MSKQRGYSMSGMTILGICMIAIGMLIVAYGGVTVGFSLSVDFQSFLLGGLILAFLGMALIPLLPIACKVGGLALVSLLSIVYIHSMPNDFELMMKLVADVAILGGSIWIMMLFLRK